MSIFGSIMSKIFHAGAAAEASKPTDAPAPPTADAAPAAPPSPADPTTPTADAPVEQVDVEAVLSKLAATKGGGGNYQSSIVDLMKLLDLDSSLTARKELANEFNLHVGADGSAEQNVALHKAVMQKLEENGGKVPASMKG